MSPFARIARYAYSPANLWGSLAGFGGLVLLFAGVIDRGWLAIVLGLYAAAAFAAPRPRASGVVFEDDLPAAEVEQRLRTLIDRAKANVSAATGVQLEHLRESLLVLLPRLAADTDSGLSEADRVQLRQTVLTYLPQTIDTYLKLPRLYRSNYVVRDGKTAESLFVEQLGLLTKAVDDMAARFYQTDAQALVTQGRFLEDRFRKSRDFIAVAPPAGKS